MSLTAVAQAAPLLPRRPAPRQPRVQRLYQRLRQVLSGQRAVVPVEDREDAQVRRQGPDRVRLGAARGAVALGREVLALGGDERAQRRRGRAGAPGARAAAVLFLF